MAIKRKPIFIIALLLLAISMYTSMPKYPAHAQETPPREGYFDSNYFCDEIVIDAERPPVKWLNITLGVSTLDDLRQTLAEFGYAYDEGFRSEESLVVFLPPVDANYWEFGANQPTIVSACIEDNIVTLIQVDIASLEKPITFESILAKHGAADAVTWGVVAPHFRLMFWFEQGFAQNITASASVERNIIDGVRIMNCIYFPSQDAAGYETRYPYNRTLPFRDPSQFKLYEGESPLQNPFNFLALAATMTAQPSSVATIVPTIEADYHTPQDFCP